MKKIIVIGEDCQDRFVYGHATRLNPESPTPVFIPEYTHENRGMAGNVRANLVHLMDRDSELKFISQETPIVKERFIDIPSNYILLRIDQEKDIDRIEFTEQIYNDIRGADLVVVSDYNKGFLLEEDLEMIFFNAKLSFLDTKKPLGDWATGCNFIKINEAEYNNPEHREFLKTGTLKNSLIVTLGGRGCRYKEQIRSGREVEVRDVVGAGDTFLAALAVKYLDNKDIGDAMIYANLCSASVVSQKGVAYPDTSNI